MIEKAQDSTSQHNITLNKLLQYKTTKPRKRRDPIMEFARKAQKRALARNENRG